MQFGGFDICLSQDLEEALRALRDTHQNLWEVVGFQCLTVCRERLCLVWHSPRVLWDRESPLKNWLDEIGLWACLWETIMTVDDWGPSPLGEMAWGYIRQLASVPPLLLLEDPAWVSALTSLHDELRPKSASWINPSSILSFGQSVLSQQDK